MSVSPFQIENAQEVDRFESEFITMWFEDGILCIRFVQGLELTLEIAKACVEARIYYSKGLSYPIFIDMRGLSSTTSNARKYLASAGATLVQAGALLIESAVTRSIGNLFIRIDRPPVPARLFTDSGKAKAWLKMCC